jgi:FHS family L-fucose permease-like MFS transporter
MTMYKKALSSLTILFFMMGFITCLNDILVPYLKAVFKLDYTQAALIQFCFFGAYGLTSIPASKIIEKIGYQKGMVLGFSVTALGCLLFFPAVSLHIYGLFLVALFVLASGVVLLQVAANPYVSVIGPKESASSRLTMVQAFNSFGTFLAPFFGSYFILRSLAVTHNASAVRYPYLIIACVLIVIAFMLSRLHLPLIASESDGRGTWKKVMKDPGLILGMIGIFAYVGAEVAIGSFLVNYIIHLTPMPETEAATLVAIYWGGAMAGRFLGIFTLKEFAPGRVLAIHSMLAIALILISINSRGQLSIYSMILIGFCNSIMFPTIFTLGIKNLGHGEEQKGSGLLATAILGGAIVPVVTGKLIDSMGFRVAFLLPVLCYGYIAILGLKNISVKVLSTEKIH